MPIDKQIHMNNYDYADSVIALFGISNLPNKYTCTCLNCPKSHWIKTATHIKSQCTNLNVVMFERVLPDKDKALEQAVYTHELADTVPIQCSMNPNFIPDEKSRQAFLAVHKKQLKLN